MRVIVIVSGFLGSGKTTTLVQLGRALRLRYGKRVAIVVNEIGEVDVDGKFIRDFGLEAKEILGGCICCSIKQDLITTIKTLLASYSPDVILIEPTGVALPQQVASIISDLTIEYKDISLAPIVVLVDGTRFKEILRELRDFLLRQVKAADIIGINKIDLVDRKFGLELLKSALRELNPNALLIPISAKNGEGIDTLLSALFSDIRGGKRYISSQEELIPSLSFGINGCGIEAKIKSKREFNDLSLKILISELINGIVERSFEMGGSLVGHVKAHVETSSGSFKASLVNINLGVDFSGNIEGEVKDFGLALFATIKDLHHDKIKHVIESSLQECIERYSLTAEFVEKHHEAH